MSLSELISLDSSPIRISVSSFDESTVDAVRNAVNACFETNQNMLVVDVCTDGGLVYELMAMIDLLETAKANGITVITYASGKAFSCGAILLAAGSPGYRYAGNNATVMVHEVHGGSAGEPDRAAGGVREIHRVNRRLFHLLGEYTQRGAAYWSEMIKSKDGPEIWMDAKKAKRHGIVDVIGTPVHVAVNQTNHIVLK